MSPDEHRRLKGLASQLASASGDLLAASQRDLSQNLVQVASLRQEASACRDRTISIARNRASQALIEHASVVSELSATLVSDSEASTSSLSVAEFILLGDLVIDDRSASSQGHVTNRPTHFPAVAPFLNHSNLLVQHRGLTAASEDFVTSVVLQALLGTGPGQLILHFYDPLLKGTSARFVDLRNARKDLLPEPRTTPSDLDALLNDVTRDVIRINEYFRGREMALGQLREESNQLIESYQLVVLRDFPSGIDDHMYRKILAVIQSAPRCGISFLIDVDVAITDSVPGTVEELSQHATVVDLDALDVQPLRPAELKYIPTIASNPSDITRPISELCRAIKDSELPSITFEELHGDIPRWSRSSSDGITAHIGRSGLDLLSVTLGDEKSQRHNILVSGAVGQGKSNLLMALVHSVAWQYSPDEVAMYLLDLKEGLTLSPLARNTPEDPSFLPHARVLGLESDQAYACAVLGELVHEFEKRAELIRPHGDNISRYRQAVPHKPMPRILVIVDEFQKLFSDDERWSDQALLYLVQLAREGRAYGIHLVLASQTLSGITALLSQQDGIFSQFPIRLALKNSVSESHVVLGVNNIEAARLRFRGEIVVNEDFGMPEANRRGTVVNASPEETLKVRRQLWRADPKLAPPSVFDGASPAAFEHHLDDLRNLRDAGRSSRRGRYAVVGTTLSSHSLLVGPDISTNSGSHLAVIGAGSIRSLHSAHLGSGPQDASSNLALGSLISATLSLAIQHPQCDAQFVFLDLLEDHERESICLNGIFSALSHLGFSFQHVRRTDVPSYVNSLPVLLQDRDIPSDSTYLIGFGLDRINLTRQDPISGESAVDGLRYYLVNGPGVHAHLFAWWTSMSSFNSALGFEADGEIANALILGVDQSELAGLMGPFVQWNFTPNRGLLHMGGMGEPRVVVPIAPASSEALDRIRVFEWDL